MKSPFARHKNSRPPTLFGESSIASHGPSPFPPPPPSPDDGDTLPSHEPSDDSMAGSDYDWAGNSVPWDPELPIFEPSHNLLLEAGPWTVPYSDFTPPASPFALEMRAETIEQLVGGDALRRGESERIETGRSEVNSDLVAGRDRVRVQGTLHEHTGHGLVEQAAHLDTTVDARLDVDAGSEDTVLLAGHMKDVWDGGTAIVAAMTDDLVAGGGVRVTAPLDLWVHGLIGVEERIGTCSADAVLLELGATHYEREYGPGAHAAGLASYTGSLYQSNRSTFRPLMRVSSGVRNLIAGGGGGGAGGAPDALPPPAPAAGGAGTQAVSETFSAATGSARSVDAVVESGARSEGLTGVRRYSDAARSEELAATHQAPAAQLNDLADSLRPAGDQTGDQSGIGSLYGTGSDWRVPQENVERFDTQMDLLGDVLQSMNTMFPAEQADSSLIGRTDDLSGLSRSADSAEQLAVLQRGDMNPASLESIVSPTPSVLNDADGPSDMSRAGTPVPARDLTPTGSPDSSDWEGNFLALTINLGDAQYADNRTVVDVHQAAVDAITNKVLTTFTRLGGDADLLALIQSTSDQAMTACRVLQDMADEARQAGDIRRADDIVQALQEINHHAYQTAVGLIDSVDALGGPGSSGMDDLRYAGEIPDASTSVPGGDGTPLDPARFDAYESVPNAEIPELPEIPPDLGWEGNYGNLSAKYMEHRRACMWFPLIEYTRAVMDVDSAIRTMYRNVVGGVVDLTQFTGLEGTRKLYKLTGELATQAEDAGEARRVAEIREALATVDQLTYELVTDLAGRARDFDGTSVWMAKYRRLDPAIDDIKLSSWIQEQIDAAALRFDDPALMDDAAAVQRIAAERAYFADMLHEVEHGRDPTFHSQYQVAYLSETDRGEQAAFVVTLHDDLLKVMSDPEMHRTGAATVSVPPDLANLPLYDRSGNFIHAPGLIFAPGANANGVDDVHGAVHAASVAGSEPETPLPASAGSPSSSQGIPPPGADVRMTESDLELGFGSSVSEESHIRAELLYSPGGSVPATPVVGVAPRLGLDAHAASWPALEDAFRLTDDVDFFLDLPRADEPLSDAARGLEEYYATTDFGTFRRIDDAAAGEPLSDAARGLEEYYATTDFGTFRRIDDAAADAPDEIRPRTGPPSEGQGGRSGTGSGPGGIGFGQAEVEGASLPGRQAGATPGFGRLEPPRAAAVQFSDGQRIVWKLMKGDGFSVEDVDLLRDRFLVAASSGEIGRQTEQSRAMMALVSELTYLANSSLLSPGLFKRFSDDDWMAFKLLLSLLDTPRRLS